MKVNIVLLDIVLGSTLLGKATRPRIRLCRPATLTTMTSEADERATPQGIGVERLRAIRGGHRGVVTRLTKQIDELLAVELVGESVSKLNVLLQQLNNKFDKLQDIDHDIITVCKLEEIEIHNSTDCCMNLETPTGVLYFLVHTSICYVLSIILYFLVVWLQGIFFGELKSDWYCIGAVFW